MSALPADLYSMKDSPSYQPILRAILKSQIQLLVEQLCETGEETLILTANIHDGMVDQLGSNYGKQFVEVYDDFKAEFLGFCQKKDKKRKMDQAAFGEAKKAKGTPVVIPIKVTRTDLGSDVTLMTAENVPKVSSARVITRQGQTSSQSSGVQEPSIVISTVQEAEEGEESQESTYSELEESELGYEEMEDSESFKQDVELPSSEPEVPAQTRARPATQKPKDNKEKAVIESPGACSTAAGGIRKIKFARSQLIKNTCEYCGKVFGSARDMKLHERSHTGEKPYTCGVCAQTFSLKRSAEIHMMKAHQMKFVAEQST